MNELIVYTYNTEDQAAKVLSSVASLKQEHVQKPLIKVEDAAVVIKNEKGKIKVRQTLESVVKGNQIVGGGFWGLLIGFLFGGPLFGSLLGLGVTALMGRKLDIGIDNTFIDSVGETLKTNNSALFLLVSDTPIETVAEALRQHGGTLHHTTLSKEAAEAFEKVSKNEEIAAALTEELEK